MSEQKDLGKLVAHFMADIQDWEKAAKKMEQDIKGVERSTQQTTDRMNANFERVGRTMEKVGKNMTRYVSLPLAGIGAASFKMGKDFEASMSKIIGLVGVAADQVDDWSKDLIEMAPDLGKSPKELADALFFVTSAGFRGAEAMDVLEVSAKAAAAGLGETKDVADLVTSAINAYGIENLNATQATDTLVAAVREGKAEATELAQSMGMVLPVASEMGVSFDQVGAAVAAMTRTGTDAGTASMQLRQILAALLKPTNQAEEALAQMGTSSQELREMMAGPEGLVGVLGWLREATEGNSTAMAEVFPNVRALSGVLDIMGKNAEENIAIFSRMTDSTGALAVAFEAATDTMEFRWQRALSAGQASLTQLGGAMEGVMIPILDKTTQYLQTFTKWFGNLDKGTQQWIIRLGALLVATGPVLVAMGTFTRVILPLMTSQILMVRTAMIRLNAVMLANPWVAAATAILMVAGAIARVAYQAREANRRMEEVLGMEVTGTHDELLKVNQAIDDQVQKLETLRAYYAAMPKWAFWLHKGAEEHVQSLEEAVTQLALQRSEIIRLNREQQNGLSSQLEQLRIERDILADKQELTEEERARLVILNDQIRALEDQLHTQRTIRTEQEEANKTLSELLTEHTAKYESMLDIVGDITSESWDQIVFEIRKSQELERQIALRRRLALLMASGVGEGPTPQAGEAAARDDEGQLVSPPDPGMFDGFNEAIERTRTLATEAFVDIGEAAGALDRSSEIASERMTEGWDAFVNTLKETTLELDQTVTQAFHSILNATDKSLKAMVKITLNTARQIVGAEIAKGVAAAASSALQNVPFPFNIAAAAGAGAAAAALFSRIIPEFHKGGEVPGSGELLAMLEGGEYVLTKEQKKDLQAGKSFSEVVGGTPDTTLDIGALGTHLTNMTTGLKGLFPEVPEINFAGAFHSGGIIPGRGEQLALVEGGERVFTQDQMRTMEPSGGKIQVAFRIPLEMDGRTIWEANKTYELDIGGG